MRVSFKMIFALLLVLGAGFVADLSGREAGAQDRPGSPDEPSSDAPGGPEFAEDRILVKPEEGAAANRLEEINRANDARVEERLPETGVRVVDLPRDLPVQAALNRYRNAPGIEYAEPDFLLDTSAIRPDDPRFEELYALENTGQTGGAPDADIGAPEAWDTTTGRQSTVVAVIDTGTNIRHPDLSDNVWVNRDETPNNGRDDDGNGYVDDVNGWDFYNDDKSVYDSGDGDRHGTHVAGTVAARGNNDRGVTGVSWKARIMPLKFLGPDGGYTSDAVKAIDYAVNNGATISNNSWSGTGRSRSLKDAITRAGESGHLVIAAAGNASNDNDQDPFYPASYDNDNIISVAATDGSNRLASFSNFGPASVDLGAPGVGILSTVPGNDYRRSSGTSMAAPHVAGVAALLKSVEPSLGYRSLRSEILRNANDLAALDGRTVTGGRLDAARAVGSVAGESNVTLATGTRLRVFGQGMSLRGRLTSGGRPLAGEEVYLLQRPLGASGFRRAPDGTVRTNSRGYFSLRGVKPRKHTFYRVRFAGSGDIKADTSDARRVNVKVRVPIRARQSNLKLGRRRSVTGRVLPEHRGKVRLVIKRNGKLLKRVRLNLDRGSRYRYVFKPPRLGRYHVFAVRAKDRDHFGNRSPVRSFRVVR